MNKEEIDWLQLPKSTKLSNINSNLSQRQQFEANPSGYLQSVFKLNSKSNWPQSIVGFGGTMEEVGSVLKKYGYIEKTRLWNCLIPVDGNNECTMSVYERRQEKKSSLRKFFS